MVLILAVIAVIGAGVVGARATTGYHAQPPATQAAVDQASLATPPASPRVAAVHPNN